MASKILFSIVILCFVTRAFSFWTPCAQGRPPIDVFTPSCTDHGCTAVRGEQFNMKITLDFLEIHSVLRPRGTVIIFGIPIAIPPVPGHDDVCPGITLNGTPHGCPVRPNTVYDWTIDMIVPETLPTFNNQRVRVEIIDENNRVLTCFDAHGNMV